MKHLIAFLTALPLLVAGAGAQDTVRIDGSCATGSAFPIAIPVRLSPNDTAFYKWYCNGKLIDNSDSIATSTNRKITYTIPANSGYSGDVAFHFTYRLNDDCCEWTRSPTYVISFSTICPPTPGAINFTAYSCSNGVSTPGVVSFSAYSCNNGISTAGVVSFSAYSCSNGVSTAGAISFSAYSCSNGISTAGAISFAPASK